MKLKLAFVVVAALLPGALGLAQTQPTPSTPPPAATPPTADDWKPISYVSPGQQFPQLNSEKRAKFRIEAPGATEVAVSLGRPLIVTKGDDGVWTVITSPLVEGFHYYQIIVDGARAADPNTRTFFGSSRWMSGIDVPSDDQDFFAVKEVPHGAIREQQYYSSVSKAWRRCFVYTPLDYDKSQAARYPVCHQCQHAEPRTIRCRHHYP